MLEYFARYWWAVALRGAVAVLFGIVALIWPDVTVTALVLLFGFYALVDGLLALAAAIRGGRAVAGRRGWLVLEGITGVAAAVLAFVWPDITAVALVYLIGAWAILTGVFEVVVAIALRRELRGELLLALSGVVSVLFGVYVWIRPGDGAVAIVWLIGLYAIVFGVALVALGLRLRQVARRGTALA